MKTQIVIDRSTSDYQAIAVLMAESTTGFVAVANVGLYDPGFDCTILGWQTLAGLLSTVAPKSAADTASLLQRYQTVSAKPVQTVVWTGGG